MDKKKILVVDDEPTNIRVIGDILSSTFQVKAANSGENALKSLASDADVSLILLDVMMPEMDGYEVCKQLKSLEATKHIPVIFVSALTSVEEQIAGFEAGAEDYLPKPVSPDILLTKINTALENDKRLKELDYAQSTAMTALMSLNEMGTVSQYFCSLIKIKSIDKAVKHMTNFIQSFGLSAVLRIALDPENIVHASTNDIERPIELSLLDKLVNKGNVFSFKTATVFNQSTISLLVTNMPVEENELYGRLKDNFMMIVEGTNSAIESIIKEKKLIADISHEKDHSQKLSGLIETFDSVLFKIKQQQTNYIEGNEKIIDVLIKDMEEAFISLGLSENQEEELLKRVRNAMKDIQALVNQNCVIQEEIDHITAILKEE